MSKADERPVTRAFAPAKINLALHVVGRRPDGFHLLDSLVGFADIGDSVRWRAGGNACRLTVEDHLDRPEPVPVDTSNLAWRALALAGRTGGAPIAGDLHLIKHLPSGAGIGGGSSDAAAVLRAVLGDDGCDGEAVRRGALALGADVPVCLAARPSRMRGIGERVEPVIMGRRLACVLVWPEAGLSTPAVFRARAGDFGAPISEASIRAFATDPLVAIQDLRNDLEDAARSLMPEIGHALDRLRASSGCRLARMSGSGSCVVGYFQDPDSTAEAAARIATDAPGWWVRPAALEAGPSPSGPI